MNGQRIITLAWIASLGLITYRDFQTLKSFPPPAHLLYGSVAFSLVMGLGIINGNLGAAFAVGLLLVLALQPGILPWGNKQTAVTSGVNIGAGLFNNTTTAKS